MKTKFKLNDDVLVRKLLELPFPTFKLDFKIPGFDKSLYVRALSSSDYGSDSNMYNSPGLLMKSVLLPSGKKAFTNKKIIENMYSSEIKILTNEVKDKLNEIGPTFATVDYSKLKKRIIEGVNHKSNNQLITLLGQCFDVKTLGNNVIFLDRPELYFNTKKDLLDCHMMVYCVCRDLFLDKSINKG